MKRHIHVASAVIIKDGLVFAAQRADKKDQACRWEFPGGKLEEGESAQDAVVREIAEELSLVVSVDRPLMRVEHQGPAFSLTMDVFVCTPSSPHIVLTEHLDSRWFSQDELWSVDWADADIPVVHEVAARLAARK